MPCHNPVSYTHLDVYKRQYGNWGSRKYLIASLDQSLKRLGLDYVDIFYHHRMDPDTPLEETIDVYKRQVQILKSLEMAMHLQVK